jgi:ABC-type lipoprotein release transport system permease subunit
MPSPTHMSSYLLDTTLVGEAVQTVFPGSSLGGQACSAPFYDVQPIDLSVYATIVGFVLVTAPIAWYIPAYRAVRTEPVVAIRQE